MNYIEKPPLTINQIRAVLLIMLMVYMSCVRASNDGELNPRLVMDSMVIPASDIIWSIDNSETDQNWEQAKYAATLLIASGYLLKEHLANSSTSQEVAWEQYSEQMSVLGKTVLQASMRRNINQVITVGGQLLENCSGCHSHYVK